MTFFPHLTLTQAKAAGAVSWTVVIFFQSLALLFPVRGLPFALRACIAAVLVLTIVIILYVSLSTRVEKPDERAAYNSYRANSAIFEIIFVLFGFFVLFGRKWGLDVITLSRGQIILLFAVLNLAHEGAFLLYERFGK